MASKLVQITDVDKAWKLWEAGLLVNECGNAWGEKRWWNFTEEELLERFPAWLEPKKDGGGYVYVETDED